MLIGLSARKQGGKSTAAMGITAYMDDHQGSYSTQSFADPLKEIVLKCFVPYDWGLTLEDLLVDDIKNRITPCGKSIRKLLQIVGTDWFRNTDSEVWTRTLDNVLDRTKVYNIIPDVRFPNEVKYVQENGGIVLRLLRRPFGDEDLHASETALDEMQETTLAAAAADMSELCVDTIFDCIIDNTNTTVEEMQALVMEVVAHAL